MARQRVHTLTNNSPPLDPHIDWHWFDTDGTTDPSVFSGTIASVTRETDASSTNAFYRVTLREDVYRSPNGSKSIYSETADITNAHDTQYNAKISTRAGAPSGGTTPTSKQIDVIVLDHEQTTVAPTWVNNVPAGHRVSITVVQDMSAPKS